MKGYPTTFIGLSDNPAGGRPRITSIEIPIIQRDFVQGRTDGTTTAVRERFLDKVVEAATTDANMSLDFVYGEVREGVMRPLDGQQRLTTLFLLHWYVASRAGVLDETPADVRTEKLPWLNFSYATRPSARAFTQKLADHPYPGGSASPSAWTTDQPWYPYPWRQDPTIKSMLVMLDAIHSRLNGSATDFRAVWNRLSECPVAAGEGAIWFLFLPVVDVEQGEELYIKMNSRGRPLTEFEIFKADFEKTVAEVDPTRREDLVAKMDGAWTDLLWKYENQTNDDWKIDDEFVRYLTCIIEISEWRDGCPDRKWADKSARRQLSLEDRARLAFTDPGNAHAERNLDFLFHAFDTWVETQPGAEMSQLFTAGGEGAGPLRLFSTTPDLFGACISSYGSSGFSTQETLLLFATLLLRQAGDTIPPASAARRIRSLRNVTAASLSPEQFMPAYVASTERLILGGEIEGLEGFNKGWTADEAEKWTALNTHPDLESCIHQLEDNPLLRGRLMAFELDAATLPTRANAFTAASGTELRDLFGAALLSKGDYSRDVGWEGDRRQLGSSAKDETWTSILTTGSRSDLHGVRTPLMSLLDDVARRTADGVSARGALELICREWLNEREARDFYDWRYYLVRYPGARSSQGEGYYHGSYKEGAGGFALHGLRMLHGSNYTAYCTDAILNASWLEGGLAQTTKQPRAWREDPALELRSSGIRIRNEESDWKGNANEQGVLSIAIPDGSAQFDSKVNDALKPLERADVHWVHEEGRRVLKVPVLQRDERGQTVDAEDRVQLCVRIARALVGAGL